MTKIQIDFEKPLGKIKPMHAMGQPPFDGGFLKFDFSHMQHLQNASVPYSRLHDVGGPYGANRFVDIPNIFRDFDADESDPTSYDFAFTDVLLEAMAQYELKPIFRLGVTIENQMSVKPLRIHPPKDFAKWARICEHIIRHYNEGWADGFHYGIEYWEIWNEPENGATPETNQMWTGTPEQYFELYDVTAKHLKACFGDSIKVGGYGSCGFGILAFEPEKYGYDIPRRPWDEARVTRYRFQEIYFYDFLAYIKEHKSPIDFFSWHSYSKVEVTRAMDDFVHKTLTKYGYGDLETQLNEWNNAYGNENHGTSYASASVAAMMCAMQNAHVDMMCYYDSRLQASSFGGLFAPLTYKPVCTYYSFQAFGELYELGTQVEAIGDSPDVYVLAATDGDRKAVIIVNTAEEERTVSTNLTGDWTLSLIDREHLLTPTDLCASEFVLGANQVAFLKC